MTFYITLSRKQKQKQQQQQKEKRGNFQYINHGQLSVTQKS